VVPFGRYGCKRNHDFASALAIARSHRLRAERGRFSLERSGGRSIPERDTGTLYRRVLPVQIELGFAVGVDTVPPPGLGCVQRRVGAGEQVVGVDPVGFGDGDTDAERDRDPDRAAVADSLRPTQGGITLLHHTPELTVIHLVWAPGMTPYPHDHRMWAVIGIYGGQEDNAFYRRSGPGERTLVETGGKELGEGDLVVLGDDTIHSVTNPLTRLTGAIHVYGGDFVNQPRSQWGPGAREERPYDIDEALRQFTDANEAWQAGQT